MKIPPNVFFFCKHFGTGVLIATAFVHVSTSQPDTAIQSTQLILDSFCLLLLPRSTTHACQISLPMTTLLSPVSS